MQTVVVGKIIKISREHTVLESGIGKENIIEFCVAINMIIHESSLSKTLIIIVRLGNIKKSL